MAFARSASMFLAAIIVSFTAAAAAPFQAGAVLIRQPGLSDTAHIDGVAILRILARPRERIREANLDASSGNASFDAAALRAVRRWRYVPALTGVSTEPEWLLIRMVYAPAAAGHLVRAAAR